MCWRSLCCAAHIIHKIEIVPYDKACPERFAAEEARLRTALGSLLRFDHHGSTSVPAMAAKAVIDIQVSVQALEPIETYRPGGMCGALHALADADLGPSTNVLIDEQCPFGLIVAVDDINPA
jgi:hypothetical protein